MIHLQPKYEFRVPINGECITPDNFADKSTQEIEEIKIQEGNKQKTLGELFKITIENPTNTAETCIKLVGNLEKIRRIGACMSMGEIIIEGNVGMHLGEEMKNGKITVLGDAGSWAGCMMKDGIIEIKGNAGDYIGSAYRGSTKGMKGGKIIIHGNVGNELGCFMQNGTIKVYGNAGQFVGMHMKDGTILVKGNTQERAGACMKGGKVVLCGYTPSILPTFTIDSIRAKTKVEDEELAEPFYLFIGDLTEKGDGRLFVAKNKNPHLSFYEKYL